jgi:hypothetical protein
LTDAEVFRLTKQVVLHKSEHRANHKIKIHTLCIHIEELIYVGSVWAFSQTKGFGENDSQSTVKEVENLSFKIGQKLAAQHSYDNYLQLPVAVGTPFGLKVRLKWKVGHG